MFKSVFKTLITGCAIYGLILLVYFHYTEHISLKTKIYGNKTSPDNISTITRFTKYTTVDNNINVKPNVKDNQMKYNSRHRTMGNGTKEHGATFSSPIRNPLIRSQAYDHVKKQYDTETPIQTCNKNSMKPTRHVTEIRCLEIIKNNAKEINKTKKIMFSTKKSKTADTEVADYTTNCSNMRSLYTSCAYSEEELQYPIAYSILCHTDAAQVERLLRTIYQPQNVYCIHPDAKASEHFHRALKNIAQCFSNVFIASQLETVVYASFSRLQAEINCFKDLLKRKEKWKYLINLVGQVFPLKTNLEIVRILKIYNGANDIEGMMYFMHFRTRTKYAVMNGEIVKTEHKKTEPVPGNLKLVKGSAYGVFSHSFLDFVMKDKVAREFLQWSNDTKTPDEHYWATLNHLYHNPNLTSPGGYRGIPHEKPFLAVYASWRGENNSCFGMTVRDVCVFGIEDVPKLLTKKHLFANKFYTNFQYLTLECLGEWYYNRTMTVPYFNTTYYEHLPFVIPSK